MQLFFIFQKLKIKFIFLGAHFDILKSLIMHKIFFFGKILLLLLFNIYLRGYLWGSYGCTQSILVANVFLKFY